MIKQETKGAQKSQQPSDGSTSSAGQCLAEIPCQLDLV
ncbi:unnamed protein product, partial [Cercopithifilaria johnstoni]